MFRRIMFVMIISLIIVGISLFWVGQSSVRAQVQPYKDVMTIPLTQGQEYNNIMSHWDKSVHQRGIVFSSNRGDGENYCLYVVGVEKPFVCSPGYDNFFPKWSPDGMKIAWEQCKSEACHLWVADFDGENQHPIGKWIMVSSTSTLAWTPEGKVAIAVKGATREAILAFQGDDVQEVPTGEDISVEDPAYQPGASTDMYFSGSPQENKWNIYSTDAKGKRTLRYDRPGININPAVSKDGRIAFANSHQPHVASVWYQKPGDTSLYEMTNSIKIAHIDLWPDWSPDGTRLVVTRLMESGFFRLVVFDVVTGHDKQPVCLDCTADDLGMPTLQPTPTSTPKPSTPQPTATMSKPTPVPSATKASKPTAGPGR